MVREQTANRVLYREAHCGGTRSRSMGALYAKGYALHFVWRYGGERITDDCSYAPPPDTVHCDKALNADGMPYTSGIIITDPGGDVVANLRYRLA
jgi:hypothetical protein